MPAAASTVAPSPPHLSPAAQEILDSLVEGLAIFTSGLQLSYINQNARFMLQLAPRSFRDRSLHDIFPEHVAAALRDALARAARGEAVLTYELTSRFPEGTEIALGLAVSPAPGPPRPPGCFVVTCRDLSVAREVIRLHEVAQAKEEFFSAISHELRTPLTSLIAYAECLERGMVADEAERREFAGIMRRESERLNRLIDEVLDLSRMEANRLTFQLQELDLGDLLREGVESIGAHASKAGVRVELAGGEGPASVVADPERVSQIVANLLGNSVKFTPAGGRVTVGWAARTHQVETWVSDTGIGIAPEDLTRVFEKFERIERPGSSVKGTGLGLAITKGLVERMGGRIWMESEPGKGTKVSFTLPRTRETREPQAAG